MNLIGYDIGLTKYQMLYEKTMGIMLRCDWKSWDCERGNDKKGIKISGKTILHCYQHA